jgi:PAS domain S-box-containing protein
VNQFSAQELQRRLAAIVDWSNDAIISKNLDGVISTWNRAAERLFGYSEAEAVGQSIGIIVPADLRDEESDILRRVRAGERIEHYETRRVARDGRILDVSLTISPLKDAAGVIVGASKILRDVTETNRARAALKESERRLADEVAAAGTLQSISTRLMSELTQDSLFTQILDAAMELMRSDASSVQMLAPDGHSLMLLGSRGFDPDSAAFWQRVTADARSTCGVALRDNMRVLVSDVESCAFMAGTRDLEEYRRCGIRAVQSTPLRSRDGRPLGMISTHWHAPHTPTEGDFRLFDVLARQAADLIERMRASEALRESEERLIDAQEEERARIARELHDDVVQRLAVISINLDMRAQRALSPDEVMRKIIETREAVISLATDVQALSHRLHPARLEHLGIAGASAVLCREMSHQRGLEIIFSAETIPNALSKRAAVAVYRVLQEALQNAVKHSGAVRIETSLRAGADRIELTVRDFGVGFDVSATNGHGLGLTSMKERLKAVRGRLTIQSEARKGTTIHASVPLRPRST